MTTRITQPGSHVYTLLRRRLRNKTKAEHPGPILYLSQESGSLLLLESGSRILIEQD